MADSLQNVNEALEDTGQKADGQAKSNAMLPVLEFAAEVFQSDPHAMQMPSVIKAVEKDLADGKSVVMQPSTPTSNPERLLRLARRRRKSRRLGYNAEGFCSSTSTEVFRPNSMSNTPTNTACAVKTVTTARGTCHEPEAQSQGKPL